ncbi:hypothetical protein GA0115240_144817 [Streptomyces sp. DvalAA-14]|uniref:hypothetical protein n=1 Tax=unclassified Streptomyces TaxID=2593676 RepID=UPI00081B12DE|nr:MULTISPECIES: hypothetical protein [unclassified Streptomyces]MYS22769.1 hypothetical protein [Streptomyces sp. SID4948]SCE22192.1 hypothetical protein GA0115240_144817 [Streptomyces sp. DvalAA-14]
MPVDERSFACVVLSDADGPTLPGEGAVVRWHLDVKDEANQAGLLDMDCMSYVWSVAEELRARDEGLRIVLDEIGPAYQEAFLATDKRPRDFIVRPVRIACQNVIVALAAFSQDSAFDGLGVVAWQTCEAPHVATNEANRALAALMLCDAFKSGGTMEVRFDRPARVGGLSKEISGHPEGRVPAALRRFGRTVGLELGLDDPRSISPAEARELFRAVTPMPDDLRSHVDFATFNEGIAPERLYFALMTGTWHPLELDFMLATTNRTSSIVSGGAPWQNRAARQAESEVCRSGVMASMLHSRLDHRDSAGNDSGVRVLEDDRRGVRWHVDGDSASVEFVDLDSSQPLPWCAHGPATGLRVFPRTAVTAETIDAVRAVRNDAAALLVPLDSTVSVPSDILVMRCSDRLADLDKAIEAKLLTSRIARA